MVEEGNKVGCYLSATFPQREGGRLGSRQGKDAQEQERLAALELLCARDTGC
jgi:hypothetical protein